MTLKLPSPLPAGWRIASAIELPAPPEPPPGSREVLVLLSDDGLKVVACDAPMLGEGMIRLAISRDGRHPGAADVEAARLAFAPGSDKPSAAFDTAATAHRFYKP